MGQVSITQFGIVEEACVSALSAGKQSLPCKSIGDKDSIEPNCLGLRDFKFRTTHPFSTL